MTSEEFANITLTFAHGVLDANSEPGAKITIPATENCQISFESTEKARDCFNKLRLLLALDAVSS